MGDGDSEEDERRRWYPKEDETEINNAPCVIGQHGPNLVRL